MGVARILGLCVALLFASSVTAAVTIDLGPSDYTKFGPNGTHTGAGIRSSFGQTVRLPPLSSNLVVTRNAVVPYASAAARMRPFTSVHPATAAASAAVTGLFLAMEWYFDEEIGQWSVREIENIPPIEGTGWRITSGPEPCRVSGYPSPEQLCLSAVGGSCNRRPLDHYAVTSPTSGYCRYQGGSILDFSTPGLSCPPGSELVVSEGVCQQYESTPVIQGEYSRLEGQLPFMSAGQVASGTGDAQRRFGEASGYNDTTITGPSSVAGPETTSTSTDPVTGDTIVTNTSSTTNISYGDTTITTSTTTTSTTYQNGQETSTTVTEETPGELPVDSGGGSSGDWPGFCDWATVVCDWLDWTQEDPPPEEPLPALIDDDFFEQKNISFGAKSCPPPYEINLSPFLEKTVGVSFQPLCDFAALIYYMVMAASYIIAAYISIGVARNG